MEQKWMWILVALALLGLGFGMLISLPTMLKTALAIVSVVAGGWLLFSKLK